jgi:hypothetical protein
MLQIRGFQEKGVFCNLEHHAMPRNTKTHIKGENCSALKIGVYCID